LERSIVKRGKILQRRKALAPWKDPLGGGKISSRAQKERGGGSDSQGGDGLTQYRFKVKKGGKKIEKVREKGLYI